MRAVIALAGLLSCALASDAAATTMPLSCAQVRQYVATYGEARCLAWVRSNGWTAAQIAEARRCLR